MSAQILDGIRILDCTVFQVGPYATYMLAALGADVIKVEQPGVGDSMRGLKEFLGTPTEYNGRNYLVEEMNANKRGIAINLKIDEGKEVLRKLCERSDVFLTNYSMSVRRKLGVDGPTIKAYNPKIIYASGSAFGNLGVDGEALAFDIVGQARSGTMLGSGDRDSPPCPLTPGIGDRIASINLAYGVLGALLARERLGVVQDVTTSQLASLMMLQGYSIIQSWIHNRPFIRASRKENKGPLYNIYKCKGDRWLCLGILQDKDYAPLCKAIGREDLITDPRFMSLSKRSANCIELIKILDEILATRTYEEWEPKLREADIPFSRVNNFIDLVSDPQVIANDYLIKWDHPVMGPINYPGFPVQFSETPLTLRMPAPEVGQHTEEILIDVLEYSWEEIEKLRSEGVF